MANGFVCIVYMGHQSYVYERVEDIVPEMARCPSSLTTGWRLEWFPIRAIQPTTIGSVYRGQVIENGRRICFGRTRCLIM